jgi:acetylornithine deacetylase/succinyl-diaminopimelate desuccinylase-like protein
MLTSSKHVLTIPNKSWLQAALRGEENCESMIDQLIEFASIPSVSTDPAYKESMAKAASWLQNFGLQRGWKAEIWETPGHPSVFLETPARPGRPTLLIYGHYDVQPAEDVHLWTHPPFQPTVVGRQIYGRGVSDNKGQILAHLLALDALQQEGDLPIQVKVIIEGEEEIGSPNLPELLETHREELKADLVVVSDTSTVVKFLPTVHYSLRGIVTFEVHLEVAKRDVHSGIFGGSTPNAIHTLASLIAQMHDSDYRVVVPGFYDHVQPIEEWERPNLEAIPFLEEPYKEFIGCKELLGEKGFSTNERRWFRPTLECNGITGGFQGEGSKTIVPARASAKFSCRLVADQDGDYLMKCVERWFESVCPAWASMRFEAGHQGPPYLLKRNSETERYFVAAADALRSRIWQRAGLRPPRRSHPHRQPVPDHPRPQHRSDGLRQPRRRHPFSQREIRTGQF